MPELSIVAPALESRVGSDVVVIVAAATGDTGNADFTVSLDGKPIGRDGTVGAAVFTQFTLGAGSRLSVPLRGLPEGRHELLLVYAADADAVRPAILRPFVVGDSDSDTDNPRSYVWFAGAIAVLLLVIAVAIRRREFGSRPGKA